MKKTNILMIFFAITMLAAGACSNSFLGTLGQGPALPAGLGALRVSFSNSPARTAMPELQDLRYEYSFYTNNDTLEEVFPEQKEDLFLLEPGSYLLEVSAYPDDQGADAICCAQGSADFEIKAGNIAQTEITLRGVSYEGFGTLNISAGYPAASTAAICAFTLTVYSEDEPYYLLDDVAGRFSYTKGNDTTTADLILTDMPAGYYLLHIMLEDHAAAFASQTKLVHIYPGLSTEVDFEFSAADFIADTVVNTNDNGPGSLRQAIEKAGPNSVIRVMLPAGSVIELSTPLLIGGTDTGSLTIEGNGICLTPDENWIIDNESQLLRVTGNSDITIKRVHFKDGRAETLGAAINNSGANVNLETCIFSNNEILSPAGDGGAIFNAGTMSVKGCTFYSNRTHYWLSGSAIKTAGNGTLATITGNLFVGNVQYQDQIKDICYGNTTSNGYNVVDAVDFTEAGWQQNPFDKTFSNLGIDPLINPITFRPIAANINIITDLADFPAVDFYGEARIGAPGAVNFKELPALTAAAFISGTSNTVPGLQCIGDELTAELNPYSYVNLLFQWKMNDKKIPGATGSIYTPVYDSTEERYENQGISVTVWAAEYGNCINSDTVPVYRPIKTMDELSEIMSGDAYNYVLVNDIDFSAYTYTWWPIGTDVYPFSGIFDGNGHAISNFKLENLASDNSGLFGFIGKGAVVKNLGMKDVDITADTSTPVVANIGAITGNNAGLIQNCYVTGSVTATHVVGGITGGEQTGTIQNCYVTAAITGTIGTVGGIAAFNDGGTIQNCYSTGNLNSQDLIGGITGANNSGGIIQNCYASGNILSDGIDVGGLVGKNAGTIQNSVALNPQIGSTTNAAARRIVSSTVGGSLSNNYGDSGTMIGGSLVTTEIGLDTVNGENVGPNQRNSYWWQYNVFFSPDIWDLSITETSRPPILLNMPAGVQ